MVKNILWLCHWESPYEEEWKGGMGRYMYNLAKELCNDFQLNIDILTPNFSNYPSKQILCRGANLIRLNAIAKGNIRNSKAMKNYANKVAEFFNSSKKDYSLVHAHYWSSHLAGEAISKKGLPYILQLHHLNKPMQITFEKFGLDYSPNKWRDDHEKIAVQNSDKTIFVSNTQLEEFKKYYYKNKIPRDIEEKISIILNGADTEKFIPLEEQESKKLRKKYGIDEDSFIISYCSRLDPDKAVDRLFYSISYLSKRLKNEEFDKIKVLITGKGKDVAYLENIVKKLGLENNIQFYGYQTGKSLIEKFQISDVGAVTSIHETFGLSVIEFMSCEKPVIVWKNSGGPEEIINGSVGMVVGNYKEMADGLYNLIKNPEEKKRIGLQAREKCINSYNWDRVAKEVYSVYSQYL